MCGESSGFVVLALLSGGSWLRSGDAGHCPEDTGMSDSDSCQLSFAAQWRESLRDVTGDPAFLSPRVFLRGVDDREACESAFWLINSNIEIGTLTKGSR